jgi:hypothetical protein
MVYPGLKAINLQTDKVAVRSINLQIDRAPTMKAVNMYYGSIYDMGVTSIQSESQLKSATIK